MDLFFELILVALGRRERLSRVPSVHEWEEVEVLAEEQGVAGVMLGGLERLPAEQWPPLELKLEWIGESQAIEAQNKLLNAEARRLTEAFAAEGRRSAILKGNCSVKPVIAI